MIARMGGPPAGAGALVGQRLGKYDLLALLALGGTAEIYLARIDGMAGFEKFVVVKCLHDHLAEDRDFVTMFLDEARLGAQLDHSNIVQTLALGEHDDRYYLVMEYIAGLSLALVGRRAHERVRGGKLPVPIILNVAAQACGGQHYAHERTDGGRPLKLVHRDVSPQNLVITFEGIVKVVDFGIAKAEYRETQTRSGTVKGKFAYMSPEQCQAKDVDRRTDVFALGTIVWELLTGRRLFKRDSTYETYQAVVECRVPPPSSINHELDPSVDALVMRAMSKDPDARYPSAEAFGEAIIGYLHHRGKPSGPGEIARFFDEHFAAEIDEHGARMRELIEGRRRSVADQQQLQWDSSELDGSASVMDSELLEEIIEESLIAPSPARLAPAAQPAPAAIARAVTAPERPGRATTPARSRPGTLPPIPPTAAMRVTGPRAIVEVAEAPFASHGGDGELESFSGSVQDLGIGDDDELPAEATRIEANPTQLLADLDLHSGRTRAPSEPGRRPVPEAGGRRPVPEAAGRRPVPEAGGRRPGTATGGSRRGVGVVTPPGLRATGAPLDPLPHERDPAMDVPDRPAFGLPSASAVATVLAPLPAPAPRFADVPTVLHTDHASAARGFAAAPAQVPTVVSDAGRPQRSSTPASTRPTMMEAAQAPPPDALLPDDPPPGASYPPLPALPALPALPDPAAMMSMPPVEQVYPGYYGGYPTQQGYPDTTLRTHRPLQRWPPWLLGVMFVVVLALATGITVALARAFAG